MRVTLDSIWLLVSIDTAVTVMAKSPITRPNVPASVANKPLLNVPLANSGDTNFEV